MKDSERKKLNKEIGEYLKPIYFDEIPLGGLFTILEDHGFRACDESDNPWQGWLVGREGWVGFPLKAIGSQIRHNNRLEVEGNLGSRKNDSIVYAGRLEEPKNFLVFEFT